LCARRVHHTVRASSLLEFSDELTESVKQAHPRTGPDETRGGVPGSDPVWGTYGAFKYLNWAAKFVADLMLDRLAGSLPRSRFG
jgi:hypothetical protein